MSILAFMLAPSPVDAAQFNVGGELLRVSASLCGIIVLILAAGWLSRRVQRRGRPSGRRIRCVETFAVGARDRLLLLDADGTRLLIGIGQGGMQTLHVYPSTSMASSLAESAPLAETGAPPVQPFSELLARWTSRA